MPGRITGGGALGLSPVVELDGQKQERSGASAPSPVAHFCRRWSSFDGVKQSRVFLAMNGPREAGGLAALSPSVHDGPGAVREP